MKTFRYTYLIIVVIALILSGCSKDDDDILNPKPEPSPVPAGVMDLFKSIEGKDLSEDSDLPVYLRYIPGWLEPGIETFDHALGADIICKGQYVQFSEIKDDKVLLKTWGDNTINPILNKKLSSTTIELNIKYTNFGLMMTGEYADVDQSIEITTYLKNNRTGFDNYDVSKPSCIIIDIKYNTDGLQFLAGGYLLESIPSYEDYVYDEKTDDYIYVEPSSPFVLNCTHLMTADYKTKTEIENFQLLMNTPCLKLSEYGYGESNTGVVSIADLFRLPCLYTQFRENCLTFSYPAVFKLRTVSFPSGTFLYFSESADNANLFINLENLKKLGMLSQVDHSESDKQTHEYFDFKGTQTEKLLTELGKDFGEKATSGIPIYRKYIQSNSILNPSIIEIYFDDTDLSRALFTTLYNLALEPENLERIVETLTSRNFNSKKIEAVKECGNKILEKQQDLHVGIAMRSENYTPALSGRDQQLYHLIW